MRTKSIILGAALLAAGVASSMASNVYSVNVVGYVTLPVTNNQFYLLGNPLAANPNNVISNVLPITDANFDSSAVYVYKNGLIQAVETYLGGLGWFPGTNVIAPGKGFFFFTQYDNGAGMTTNAITFAGTVVTNGAVSLTPGYNLVASSYPASITMQGLGLGAPWAQDSDTVIRYNTPGHPAGLNDLVTYLGGIGWFDGNVGGGGPTNGPVLKVAEGFYYYNASTDNGATATYPWTQSFIIQ